MTNLAAEVDTDKLIDYRERGAVRVCEALDVAAVIGTHYDNVQYLTDLRRFFIYGWEPNSVAIITRERGLKVLEGGMYFAPGPHWANDAQALKERNGVGHYCCFNATLVAEWWADWTKGALSELGVTRGRVGVDRLDWAVLEAFRVAMPDIEFVSAEEQLQLQRAVKGEEELKLMRQAAYVASEAVAAGMAAVKPGVTENEIYGTFMGRLYELGSEGDAFFPFLTSGPVRDGAMFPTNRTVEEGDPVIIDVGPIIGGYHGDCMRTTIAGEPTKEFEELHSVNYDAMYAGIEAVKPGVKASEVDTAVRSAIHARGYLDDRFDHGHGIGLACLELPMITKAGTADSRLDLRLEPGMCFALEPRLHKMLDDGSYIQSALEETVIVTEDGFEVITSAPFAV